MNEQEKFWNGEFANDYLKRSSVKEHLSNYTSYWVKMLSKIPTAPKSILELGCNAGINLCVLNILFPNAELEAVEINPQAAHEARKNAPRTNIYNVSISDFVPNRQYDLTFSAGVLIHIAPENLPKAYETLYNASSKFILIKEYYNPVPVEVCYRGHEGKLFKRDFCGDMLDKYNDLRLVDYGFIYHRDTIFPASDATWFLLEKYNNK